MLTDPATASRFAHPARAGVEPLRPEPVPFDVGDRPGPRLNNAGARAMARAIATTLGDATDHIEQFFWHLGYAPCNHLDALRRRGTAIFFAPTVADYLLSPSAARRRGARGHHPTFDAGHRPGIVADYGPGSGVLAAFDAPSNALVFPSEIEPIDPLEAVLHELGHALTTPVVAGRERLWIHCLADLPERIRLHLLAYPADGSAVADAVRVQELFAEAYAMLVCERVDELGPTVTSAVIDMLSDATDLADHDALEAAASA